MIRVCYADKGESRCMEEKTEESERNIMLIPEIIYEDNNLIVCYKQAGVATQTKRLGQQDMESILKNYVADELRKQNKNVTPYIGVVHRLDQPVEGVMVYAKNKRAAAILSKQVQERSIGKNYYALVQLPDGKTFAEATGLPEEGTREDYMIFDRRNNLSQIVPKGTKDAKKALLDYQVIAETEGRALLDITLHTGRHHQIRLQLAGMGTPIVGDRKYGKNEARQLGLCSYRIAFVSPTDGKACEYEITPKNAEIYALFEKKDKA